MHPNVIIREITIEDAASFNAHRRRIADEPDNGITYSVGEYVRTVEEEREMVLKAVTDPNQQIFVAVVDGEIVGGCTCRGGSLTAVRHVVGLGIDVAPEYRAHGVGNALMAAMVEWARPHPVIRRIELTVFIHNRRAINLYLKHGFVFEGVKKQAYFKYGQYVDAYAMALVFDK